MGYLLMDRILNGGFGQRVIAPNDHGDVYLYRITTYGSQKISLNEKYRPAKFAQINSNKNHGYNRAAKQ
jgi:hypothetical protein